MTSDTPRGTEWERFGPWVDEVRTRDDVPRLFREHPLDLEAARLALKVPRNIPRRDATPDMDLYDHLLVVGPSDLTVLSRRGADQGGRGATSPAGYDATTTPLTRVVAVRDDVALLDGMLAVLTDDGDAVTVRYNGSSRAQVARLVDALRPAGTREPTPVGRALLEAARRAAAGAGRLDLGRADLALVSDAAEAVRSNPALVVAAGHGRAGLAPLGSGLTGAARRVAHAISPATLHGAVLAVDDVAAEVLGRRSPITRGRGPEHSSSRLVLPLAALDAVQLTPHPRYAATTVVTLAGGAARVELVVPAGSAVERLLAAAAGVTPPGGGAPASGRRAPARA